MFFCVGLTDAVIRWNPLLTQLLMVVGNTAFYGLITHLVMGLKAGWRT
jgi:hypothetical protein